MKSGKAPRTTVVSRMAIEELKFTWKIEDFKVIQKHGAMVDMQQFEFSAGESIGMSSTWRVFLHRSKTKIGSIVGIYFAMTEQPKIPYNQLCAKGSYKIDTKHGFWSFAKAGTGLRSIDYFDKGWAFGLPFVFHKYEPVPLNQGTLVIHINFKMYRLHEGIGMSIPPPKVQTRLKADKIQGKPVAEDIPSQEVTLPGKAPLNGKEAVDYLDFVATVIKSFSDLVKRDS